ncbi:MAG: hypothetical protein GC150_15110 [Rhizobiales bacterium]|nr:hypothetical protein [Hyphomicrobiales bacterium]
MNNAAAATGLAGKRVPRRGAIVLFAMVALLASTGGTTATFDSRSLIAGHCTLTAEARTPFDADQVAPVAIDGQDGEIEVSVARFDPMRLAAEAFGDWDVGAIGPHEAGVRSTH